MNKFVGGLVSPLMLVLLGGLLFALDHWLIGRADDPRRIVVGAAVEFENQALVDLLASNPAMSDTLAVFHATHANLGTGAPSALSETSLNTARTAMRLQKGIDGVTPIDATPTWLIVPAAADPAVPPDQLDRKSVV